MSNDEPKVVLVVGAGDALGSAIGRRFAREGFVACLARRNGLSPCGHDPSVLTQELRPWVPDSEAAAPTCSTKSPYSYHLLHVVLSS